MNIKLFQEFLNAKTLNNVNVVKGFIFGSVVNSSKSPKDCDLFIVTNQTPVTTNWRIFIKSMQQLENEFKKCFGLKLDITINTEAEFTEQSAFKSRVFNKKTLKIK